MRIARILAAAAVFASLTAAAGIVATTANSQAMAPFGTDEDVAYSKAVWHAMTDAKLVGAKAIGSRPYEGTEPHGFILETLYDEVSVNGHSGLIIVKRNYGPKGATIEQIANDPAKHLGAVTVMFKREAGYDADNKDWFWAKYLPDGSLDKNPKGMQLAGRVAKGADAGCIACHTGADGGDYMFLKNEM